MRHDDPYSEYPLTRRAVTAWRARPIATTTAPTGAVGAVGAAAGGPWRDAPTAPSRALIAARRGELAAWRAWRDAAALRRSYRHADDRADGRADGMPGDARRAIWRHVVGSVARHVARDVQRLF